MLMIYDIDALEEETRRFVLEGARKLKAYCDERGIKIPPYQIPTEEKLRRDYASLYDYMFDENTDPADPDIFRSFKCGAIQGDFIGFVLNHVRNTEAFFKKYPELRPKNT